MSPRIRSTPVDGLELATQVALVAVLLAQAVAIVIAEPWPEGRVLLVLSPNHGVTMGDMPAVGLVMVAVASLVLSLPRMRRRPGGHAVGRATHGGGDHERSG